MVPLVISCLTTFNLSWFMDITFQVPMQYCFFYQIRLYFYHQTYTLLGIIFTLVQPLHFFWPYFPTLLLWHSLIWGFHLSVSYLFVFSYCSWGSQGKNPEVACHFLLQCTMFVITLHHDLSVLGGLTWHGSYFHWVT